MQRMKDLINIEQIVNTCTVVKCNMLTDDTTGEVKKVVLEFVPNENEDKRYGSCATDTCNHSVRDIFKQQKGVK